MAQISTDSQKAQARIRQTLENGLQLELSTEQCERYLRRHVNSKTKIVVLYVDINGSTRLSLTLPANKLALMIQVFSQEMGLAISGYGGYVLKYVGDAVIGIFPAEYDRRKASENALNCASAMIEIIREIINPEFHLKNLPEISVKVSLDYGDSLVVLYGKNLEKSYIDIIGSNMSMAAKMISYAKSNEIVVGQSIYNSFAQEDIFRTRHIKLDLDLSKWNYPEEKTGNIYQLYLFRST